jgi:hypothetical protein
MNPEKNSFFLLAQNLMKSLPTDPALMNATLRTVISRVYFALYNEAFEALTKSEKETLPKSGDAHKEVKGLYLKDPANTLRINIGEALDGLRTLRNRADYNKVIDNIEMKTKLAVKQAKRALENLGKV